jgi:hypothetical protein
MIHRKYLGPSFTSSAFAFTRRTCIAASKTILKEAKVATDKSGPVLWIDQAFTVAAGIILCLDAYNRSVEKPEHEENRRLVEEAIEFLSQFTLSSIATRGIRLLTMLVSKLPEDVGQRSTSAKSSRKRPNYGAAEQAEKRKKTFNVSEFIRNVSATGTNSQQVEESTDAITTDMAWDAFADLFPLQTGSDGDTVFASFFGIGERNRSFVA